MCTMNAKEEDDNSKHTFLAVFYHIRELRGSTPLEQIKFSWKLNSDLSATEKHTKFQLYPFVTKEHWQLRGTEAM